MMMPWPPVQQQLTVLPAVQLSEFNNKLNNLKRDELEVSVLANDGLFPGRDFTMYSESLNGHSYKKKPCHQSRSLVTQAIMMGPELLKGRKRKRRKKRRVEVQQVEVCVQWCSGTYACTQQQPLAAPQKSLAAVSQQLHSRGRSMVVGSFRWTVSGNVNNTL